MAVTETTSESWFSRLGNSIKGILTGIVLFLAAGALLFWNEGRAVKRAQDLAEGRAAVREAETSKVDPSQIGQLIHLSGEATTTEVLKDDVFDVELTALRLFREVEMYQWEENSKSEKKKKLGGGTETVTTYTYNKTWASNLIQSSDFKEKEGHENPASMPLDDFQASAKEVTLGAYSLGESIASQIGSSEDLAVDKLPASGPPAGITRPMQLANGGVYFGFDPGTPAIGDMRVKFRVVRPQVVSIIAGLQQPNKLQPWKTPRGGSLAEVATGVKTADEMFTAAEEMNKMMTWILRAVGLILMFIGVKMLLEPLAIVADVVPFLGDLLRIGTGIVAFLVALPSALIVIAVGWLVYRPVMGIGLLVVAGALLFWLFGMARSRRATRLAQPGQA